MAFIGRLVLLAAAIAIVGFAPASAFTAVSEAGKSNFQKYRSAIPSDLNVVAAGGWNNLVKLSADPKTELVSLIVSGLKGSGGKVNYDESGKIDALAALLQSRGKGFDADLIDGEWAAVLSRQGKSSPKFQKIVNKSDHVKKAFSNFNVKDMTFDNTNYTPHSRGQLKAKVKYLPVAENFDVSADGSIVLRRIGCDIVDASFKYWKLPKLSLPLRKKGGYLDVLYLDSDIRVTRGNRGGLFVHFRPEFLEKAMSEAVAAVVAKQPIDVSIPYDAPAKLAYEASDKSMAYADFKTKYEADAVAAVIAKQPIDVSIPYDAPAKLAYEASDKSMAYADFKEKYEADAVAAVIAKQ